jgi:ubiquinol-cytochrome c reductase cytochrome b subunit
MRYDKWKRGLEPFFPNHVVHQLFIVCLVLIPFLLIVFFAPELFMLKEVPADPMNTPKHIKPEWYFLPAYQTLKIFPTQIFGKAAELVGVGAQGLFIAILLFLPFLDRNPERNVRKRPVLLAVSILCLLGIIGLGIWGKYS